MLNVPSRSTFFYCSKQGDAKNEQFFLNFSEFLRDVFSTLRACALVYSEHLLLPLIGCFSGRTDLLVWPKKILNNFCASYQVLSMFLQPFAKDECSTWSKPGTSFQSFERNMQFITVVLRALNVFDIKYNTFFITSFLHSNLLNVYFWTENRDNFVCIQSTFGSSSDNM